ncbi:unnamed protein product, partial [Polarella glacialis]
RSLTPVSLTRSGLRRANGTNDGASSPASPADSGPTKGSVRLRVRIQPVIEEHVQAGGESNEKSEGEVSDKDSEVFSASEAPFSEPGSPGSPRAHSMARSASRVSGGSVRTTTTINALAMEYLDGPMPVEPWCGKCSPLKPDASLILSPEQIFIVRESSAKEKKRASTGPMTKETQQKQQANDLRESRTQQFASRLQQTVQLPTLFCELTVNSIEEIHLMNPMKPSRFSLLPYPGQPQGLGGFVDTNFNKSVPPVLRRLSVDEVSRLERFAQHHVKMFFIQKSAALNALNPREGRKTKNQFQFGSVLQLVASLTRGTISKEEHVFLFDKLKQLPMLQDVPKELLEPVAKLLRPATFAAGTELFCQGEEANSIIILLEGDVELVSEGTSSMQADAVKQAPAVLLTEDVLHTELEKSQPFRLRDREHRMRSRTAKASSDEDASSQASGLIMPLEALELVCHHYREIEARERGALVTEFFAQTMRIQPAVCNKHRNIFAVETFGRSHVLFQEGTKPPLSVAHLYLVIEGELQLVYPQKRNRMGACRGKAYKEACGRGKFLGDAALFGESYPASVVTTKETKVLTLKAIDYLQKLLNRPGILERAQGYVPRGPPADDSEDAALENQNLLRKKVFESTMKSARIAHDAKTLQDTEWKLLHPKATLPRGRLPYGRAKVHAAAGLAAEETSTRPSSQASQDARDVHSADYLLARSFATSGPLGAGLAMLYLDAKIAQGCQAVDQLQAAHRSHTAYGYHVEDAGGARLPAGSLMSVSPGSVVLMSCGAMSPSPPVSREGPRKRQLHSR